MPHVHLLLRGSRKIKKTKRDRKNEFEGFFLLSVQKILNMT